MMFLKMSDIDVQVMNQFVIVCETYLQFTAEYSELNAKEHELRAFCEYIRANKPFVQLTDQFNTIVIEKQKQLETGIIVGRNSEPINGEFFKRSTNATIVINGGEREYRMNITDLCFSILSKDARREKGETKKDPKDVLMFVSYLLCKVLTKAVISSSLDTKTKNSICMNTFRFQSEPPRPYNPGQAEHLKGFVGKLLSHRTVVGLANKYVGEGMAEKASQAVKAFDIGIMTSQGNNAKIMEAISTGNIDGFVDHLRGTFATFVGEVNLGMDDADPTEQC